MKETPNRASYEDMLRRQEEERKAMIDEAHGNALEMHGEIDTLRKEEEEQQALMEELKRKSAERQARIEALRKGAPAPSVESDTAPTDTNELTSIEEVEESATTTPEQKPNAEEIAKLRGQIDAINSAIQHNTILSPEFGRQFGVNFSFNRSVAMEWAEKTVLALEKRIRELEGNPSSEEDEDDEDEPEVYDVPHGIEDIQGPHISITDVRIFQEVFNEYNDPQVVIDESINVNGDNNEVNKITGDGNTIGSTIASNNTTNIDNSGSQTFNGPVYYGTERDGAINNNEGRDGRGPNLENPHGNPRSVWGWIKQRMKNVFIFGTLSLHNAEQLRTHTNTVGEQARAGSLDLRQTQDLDYETALAEAATIRGMAEAQGGMMRENLRSASETLSAEQRAYNERQINTIVRNARNEVQRRLARYQDEYGDGAVTSRHLRSFETGLREALAVSTIGLGDRGDGYKREVNFVRNMRERLNPQWRRQYIYAGAEFVLSALIYKTGLNYLAQNAPIFKGLINPPGLETVHSAPTGIETINTAATGAEGIIEVPMKDTIWNTVKELFAQNGVPNPTDSQIMEAAKAVAESSGVGVEKWGIESLKGVVDTSMLQGHTLKIPPGLFH